MYKNVVILAGVLFLSCASMEAYSSTLSFNNKDGLLSKVEPKRRDEKKKYMGEVKSKNSTKRYVGDADKNEVENSKRRGTEKRYVGNKEKDQEVFFQNQKNIDKDNKLTSGNSNNAKYNWGQEKKGQSFDSKEDTKDAKGEIIEDK